MTVELDLAPEELLANAREALHAASLDYDRIQLRPSQSNPERLKALEADIKRLREIVKEREVAVAPEPTE